MAYRKISQTTCRATRPLINEFANMTMAKMDRPLSKTRMAKLREKVVSGKFTTAVWASAHCKQDGRVYRLNGKHTSTLFQEMNGELPKGIELTVLRFECDTIEDIAELYTTFDPRVSVRTQGDITRIYAASCDSIEGVSPQILNGCVTGIAFAKLEENYRRLSDPEQRAAAIVDHPEFVLWVSHFIGTDQATCKHLMRGPVYAAMFLTWCKNREACKRFWNLVKSGDAQSDCPTRKLERMLLSSRIRSSWSTSAKAIGSREMFVKCLHAWNAWRQGKQTEMKFYANAATPEVK